MPEHAESIAHDYLRDTDHLRGRSGYADVDGEAVALDAVSTQAAVDALRERLDSLDKALAVFADRLNVVLLPERATTDGPDRVTAARALPCSPLTDELLRQAERIDQATDFAHRIMRRLAL